MTLLLGGVAAEELAATYGTPLHVLDLDRVDEAVSLFRSACAPHGIEISYAAKAFVCVAFARYLQARALGLDVCSLGELITAERAGFDPARITLHGAGKSAAELLAAVEGRAARVVADGLGELQTLGTLAREAGKNVEVLLRLNTGIAAQTHAFVRTGGDDTKFGIARGDEEIAAAILQSFPELRFRGVHAHIGSQIYEAAPFAANAKALAAALERFAECGVRGDTIVAGGGFGVRMRPDALDERLDVKAAIDAIAASAPGVRVGIEPGRAIVAQAGTVLYRVLGIKRQAARTFAIVDGGIFENPRPALYGAYHHVTSAAPRNGGLRTMTVCGRSCENDVLGDAELPGDLRAGDLLAMCTTGAYTFSMAGNYNRFPRPAVVATGSGTHALFVRRETIEDVLERDADA